MDNMNRALQMVGEEMNLDIPEYTVAGIPYGSFLRTIGMWLVTTK